MILLDIAVLSDTITNWLEMSSGVYWERRWNARMENTRKSGIGNTQRIENVEWKMWQILHDYRFREWKYEKSIAIFEEMFIHKNHTSIPVNDSETVNCDECKSIQYT